jgi:hypothetical protein
MADRIQDIAPHTSDSAPSFYSDIYNTGTLVQFCPERFGMDDQKRSFLQVHYRVKNLQLVNSLEKTSFKDHDHIKKVCKALSCCSSISEIQVTKRNNASIGKTSKKCKRPFCPRCNQIQSSKYKRRFLKCYNAPENEKIFKGKYFYFITLTLRHNLEGIRTEIYIDELKKHMKEFRRSKLWKKHFPYSQKNPVSGFVQSYELTLGDNGYHIHSHILMCAPPLKDKVLKVEQNFRDKWLSLTGDSTGFRLDMIKIDQEQVEKIRKGHLSKKFNQKLSETFKYTVKLGDIHKLDPIKGEMFAKWIIATKGKNMITSNGFFRQYKLQLFTRKSKWDEETTQEETTHTEAWKYYVGKTSQITFNHDKNKHYPKEERQKILDTVFLKSIPSSFIDISDCGEHFDPYLNEILNPNENEYGSSHLDMLPIWAASAKRNKEEDINRKFEQDLSEYSAHSINDDPITQEWINEVHKLYTSDDKTSQEDIEQLFLFDN